MRRRERRRIANHLASGESAVARNVGAGVADARTDRARLRNIRLWPVRCSRGRSSGTIVGGLDVRYWGQSEHRADAPQCLLLTQSGHDWPRISAAQDQ